MNKSQTAVLSKKMKRYVDPREPGWTLGEHAEWLKEVSEHLHKLIPGSVYAPNLVQIHVGELIVTIAPDNARSFSMRLQNQARQFLTDEQVAALPINWDENYVLVGSDDVLNVVTDIRHKLHPKGLCTLLSTLITRICN
jgi:hypothetical protein